MSEYLRELDTSYTPKKGTFMYIYVISATTPLSPTLVTAFSASPVSAVATSALYVRTVTTDEARFSGFKFILVF